MNYLSLKEICSEIFHAYRGIGLDAADNEDIPLSDASSLTLPSFEVH
jgi:hypothetical protein